MLVGHDHKFIFIKTIKTAGTSVEMFLEKTMMPNDHSIQGTCDQQIGEFGIIGARGQFDPTDRPMYFNHISANRLKWLLGEATWESYYKFSIVRNPFDFLLSNFFFQLSHDRTTQPTFASRTFEETKAQFEEYVMAISRDINRELLTISGKLAVDYCIRYENLKTDLAVVLSKLGMQAEVSELGSSKSGIRPTSGVLARGKQYYSPHMRSHVMNVFGWHAENFGYDLDDLPD